MRFLQIVAIIALWIGILAVVFWRIRVRKNLERSLNMVFLQISVPIKDSKEDRERDSEQFSTGKTFKDTLDVMTLLYESLHSIYSSDFVKMNAGDVDSVDLCFGLGQFYKYGQGIIFYLRRQGAGQNQFFDLGQMAKRRGSRTFNL